MRQLVGALNAMTTCPTQEGGRDLLHSPSGVAKHSGGKILRDAYEILPIHLHQLIVDSHSIMAEEKNKE